MLLKVCLFLLSLTISSEAFSYYNDTDECISDDTNEKLICMPLTKCKKAVELFYENKVPSQCGFDGLEAKVCCQGYTEERVQKPGDLARDACIQLKGTMAFANLRSRYDRSIIFGITGGRNAKKKEFKHMALIGSGDGEERKWKCGGSLVHEEYVLTAAHCLYTRKLYVRLGDLNYATNSDNSSYQDFNVSRAFKHPNYTSPSTYNDIALLKLDRPAVFDEFVGPACLHLEKEVDQTDGRLVVAGWGKTEALADEGSSHLRKADVTAFPHNVCSEVYPKDEKRLSRGIVEELQLCAGSYDDENNTCEGDSGGPLEFDEQLGPHTLTTVIGITSFGKACGFKGIPGVYTRVSGYIKWIEDIVWNRKS